MDITNILNENGLLDAEGYLLPPQHAAVTKFTKQLFRLEELKQTGAKQSKEDKKRLERMHIAFDYYQEALEEEAQILEGTQPNEVVEEEEEIDDELYEDDDDDDDDDDDEVTIDDDEDDDDE
jgi:hypothetical protein